MIIFLFGILVFFVFCWLLNAFIVRTSLFPVLFRTPRSEYQKKKRIRCIKRQALAVMRSMTVEERKNTNWDAYACTVEEETRGAMSHNEFCGFLYRSLHNMEK